MNRISLLFLLTVLPLTARSQAVLEKTYSSDEATSGFEFIIVNEDFFDDAMTYSMVAKYVTFNRNTFQYNIYSKNHSLLKTTLIPPPDGFSLLSQTFFSTKSFNSDEKVEFIAIYQKNNSVYGNEFSMRILNEDGTVLQELGSYSSLTWFKDIDGKKKINCIKLNVVFTNNPTGYFYTNSFDIFQVVGDTTATATGKVAVKAIDKAYPNPASTTVTLPYHLPKGTTTLLRIYRLDGTEIDRKVIDSNFENLELSVSSYQPGTYLYDYNGISNKFIVR